MPGYNSIRVRGNARSTRYAAIPADPPLFHRLGLARAARKYGIFTGASSASVPPDERFRTATRISKRRRQQQRRRRRGLSFDLTRVASCALINRGPGQAETYERTKINSSRTTVARFIYRQMTRHFFAENAVKF